VKTFLFSLVSVYDKTNLESFISKLTILSPDVEFIVTKGTYSFLNNNLQLKDRICTIEGYTGYEELPEGLVKTLHPKIFFGFLGKTTNPIHVSAFEKINSKPIDLLVSNLYPFWEINSNMNLKNSTEDLTHFWDIGGPSMIMAAVKGGHTIVLIDPNDYEEFLQLLKKNDEDFEIFKRKMNNKALQYVVKYHEMIGDYFNKIM
jgi:phosphoribosylaminoimidazolecarboxamide formyltransferase/IMP cyclohydrolase